MGGKYKYGWQVRVWVASKSSKCKYGWQLRVWVASIPRNVKVAAGGKWRGGALGTCLLASA